MHGGIGRSINSVEDIEKLKRPITMDAGSIILMDLLWYLFFVIYLFFFVMWLLVMFAFPFCFFFEGDPKSNSMVAILWPGDHVF